MISMSEKFIINQFLSIKFLCRLWMITKIYINILILHIDGMCP